jgi:hypothetical protein
VTKRSLGPLYDRPMRSLPLPALLTGSLLALGLLPAVGSDGPRQDRFRQLDELLPTPNAQRNAAGAPGHGYWQQEVDYEIDVALDEGERRLTGRERITYRNNSPDTLTYLWLQLEANQLAPQSHGALLELAPDLGSMSYGELDSLLERLEFDGSHTLFAVEDGEGEPLPHVVNDTMLRVDLAEPLPPGGETVLQVGWTYRINNARKIRARTGYEPFDEGGDVFEIAHWFPRLCAYTDYAGWQNKQFLGRGEFTLEFGDYQVRITVPDDHVVASTGVLQNADAVLEPAWRERLEEAWSAEEPTFIVTPDEARANLSSEPEGTRTWEFHAEQVRDFAWASSRRFAWDALGHEVEGAGKVWAMSYYPPEGEPMWSRFSTHAVAHTLDVYSKHAVPYPYPVAISVNGPVGGMEYPMICFNGPRPEKDGTWSAGTKHGLIGVIIHEVGHNWFPMIINSDERQWTWMDEGLNTFVQFLAEQSFSPDYPSRRGVPENIVSYMTSAEQVPIMTNSESILQFGANAYAKPATALNILRETVMGRELFDYAFREYCRRWAFKRPEPADLFRTLEDASAVDLDWFWRGWFYSTDHVDLAIQGVTRYTIDTRDPEVEKARQREEREERGDALTTVLHREGEKRSDRFPALLDFYNSYDPLAVTPKDLRDREKLLEGLEERDRELLELGLSLYVVEFEDLGGVPMPVILRVRTTDGEEQLLRLPPQVWQKGDRQISKLLVLEGEVESLQLDPLRETADADEANNHWPRRIAEERLRLQEGWRGRGGRSNPMREARDEAKRAAGEDSEDSDG